MKKKTIYAIALIAINCYTIGNIIWFTTDYKHKFNSEIDCWTIAYKSGYRSAHLTYLTNNRDWRLIPYNVSKMAIKEYHNLNEWMTNTATHVERHLKEGTPK